MPANQNLFASTAVLGASAVLTSPWLDRAGSGNVPTFIVSVLADQDGSFLLYEAEDTGGSDAVAVGGGAVSANIATVASGTVNKRFLQIVYTNGATAQTSFALTVLGSLTPHLAPKSNDSRVLDLILRELRMQSLLLSQLREPASLINLPFGPLI